MRLSSLFSLLLLASLIAVSAKAKELTEVVITEDAGSNQPSIFRDQFSSFNSKTIELIELSNLEKIAQLTPGVEARSITAIRSTAIIRGITTSDTGVGNAPSVATYVDGVYMGWGGTTKLQFLDAELIEVLKGPQNGFLARSPAGAIVVNSRKPSERNEKLISLSVGNYNARRFYSILNLPINDNLKLRTNLLTEKRDGYINNRAGNDLESLDNKALLTALTWLPTENTELTLRFEYDNVDQRAPHYIAVNPVVASVDIFGAVESDIPALEKREMTRVTASFEWMQPHFTLQSTSHIHVINAQLAEDRDGTGDINRFFSSATDLDSEYFGQGFRLYNAGAERLNWEIGLSLFRLTSDQTFETVGSTNAISLITLDNLSKNNPGLLSVFGISPFDLFASPTPPTSDMLFGLNVLFGGAAGLGEFFPEQITKRLYNNHLSGYGTISYAITDQFKVDLGLDYRLDTKRFRQSVNFNEFGFGIAFAQEGEVSTRDRWEQVSPHLSFSYQPNERNLYSLRLSEGYKPGGYNSTNLGSDSFSGETIRNIELGINYDWFEHALKLETKLFYYEFKDFQILEFYRADGETIARNYISNGDFTGKGYEIKLDWAPTQQLSLGFNMGFVDTEYSDFISRSLSSIEREDRKGEAVSTMPRYQYAGYINYLHPLNAKQNILVRLDATHTDERTSAFGASTNTQALYPDILWSEVKSYTLLDLSMAATIAPGRTIRLQARNLLDKEYLLSSGRGLGSSVGSPTLRRGEPRTWWLTYSHLL